MGDRGFGHDEILDFSPRWDPIAGGQDVIVFVNTFTSFGQLFDKAVEVRDPEGRIDTLIVFDENSSLLIHNHSLIELVYAMNYFQFIG